MEFVLWEKLAGLEGKELVMLIAAAAVAAALIVLLVCLRKRGAAEAPAKKIDVRALVYGALCISLSFVLSYIKLFSMPMGGSLTLCSMLPIAMYAWAFGPAYGFTAAFAYSQPAQGGKYDVLPADSMLSGADVELATVPGREMLLKEAIAQLSKPYDYVLIDCPPSLNTLSLMALTAANGVIVPVQAQYLALDGMAQLNQTIELVRKRMNPQLEICGVLVTLYDPRKLLNKEVLESLTAAFPGKVYATTISNNIALAEAPSYDKDIFEYKPKSKGAEQYRQLVQEILKAE